MVETGLLKVWVHESNQCVDFTWKMIYSSHGFLLIVARKVITLVKSRKVAGQDPANLNFFHSLSSLATHAWTPLSLGERRTYMRGPLLHIFIFVFVRNLHSTHLNFYMYLRMYVTCVKLGWPIWIDDYPIWLLVWNIIWQTWNLSKNLYFFGPKILHTKN